MRLFEVGTTIRQLISCGDAWKYIWIKGGNFVVVIFLENINKTKQNKTCCNGHDMWSEWIKTRWTRRAPKDVGGGGSGELCSPSPHRDLKKKINTGFMDTISKVLRDLLVGEINHWNRSDAYYIRIVKNKIKNLWTCKAVPLQACSGPEGSKKLRFPDFMTMAQDGGKVVSLTHRPTLPPGNTPGTHFC